MQEIDAMRLPDVVIELLRRNPLLAHRPVTMNQTVIFVSSEHIEQGNLRVWRRR